MALNIKPSCVICAWRATCNKQFSMANPSHCPEFSVDVTIKDYPGKKGVKVLIEGMSGTGKTTLIERLITKLCKEKRLGGFFTREIREGGERKGFKLVTVDNQEGVLAHENLKGHHKVGKYVVSLEVLEKIGVASIERALRDDDVVLIDEIGRMELFSERFRDMVGIALESEKPLVATIASDGPDFVDEIKKKDGVHLITLTPENRDSLLDDIVALVREG